MKQITHTESHRVEFKQISQNFMKNVFYSSEIRVSDQASDQAILQFCQEPKSTQEIMDFIDMKHKTHFRQTILNPLIEKGLLELTIPEKPKSPNQRYKTK